MKRISLFALLLVAVLMLSLFVGCASEPAPTTPPADEPAPSAPADTTETPDAPAETPVEEFAEVPEIVTMTAHGYEFKIPQIAIDPYPLPLVNEPAEISYFSRWTSTVASTPMELYLYQELEKRTGVVVDYQCVSSDEQFQIMYASQDYADIIGGTDTSYVGGIDKAIEDEIYVDAADYAHVTPLFNAWQYVDETYHRDSKTDGGAMYFRSVQSGCEPAWVGGMVRSDWLEDCGLDLPVTYDDWHTMLTAFKDQKGATRALGLSPNGYDDMAYTLTAGYNVCPGWYHINGEIKYGFAEEGMREYVTMMHQWYSEGLVDKDFPGYDNAFELGTDYLESGEMGAWDWAAAGHPDLWATMFPDIEVAAVTSPVKNEGDEYHLRRRNDYSGASCKFITTAAVERGTDELAAKWIDYSYSLDSAYLWTFGEYGLDWEYNEDGIPVYTDHFFNHPDGKNIYGQLKTNASGSMFYIWWREFDRNSDAVMKAYHTWQDNCDAAYNIPTFGIALTTEEGEDYASPYSDIQTYVNENIPLFIRGDRSLDEWDDFVAALYQFGLQDCIDIYQAAFDRYNAR